MTVAGLDVKSRQLIEDKLFAYHQALQPQLIFTLRSQDHIPDYITHVIQLEESLAHGRNIVYVGSRSGWKLPDAAKTTIQTQKAVLAHPQDIVVLRNVNVTGRTPILHNVTWTIREGERWLLRGPNGTAFPSSIFCGKVENVSPCKARANLLYCQ